MGKIKAINISNLDGESTFYVNQAILMKNKGILNPHLDYVIHPKLNLVRKFNLIIFFSTNWKKSNGRAKGA